VAEHSNEKTALPFLLKQLELAGCIVSIDAMGCHAKIGKQIKEQDGEYVLALKANQGTLYQDVVDLFADALTPQGADLLHDYHPTEDTGPGRVERRQYWTIADPEVIAYLNAKEAWPGLRSVGMEDRGAAGGPTGDPRTSLLHYEPCGKCSGLWGSGPKPLGHRKWPALGPRSGL
jgi:predicted transposase YbfD/YdcC